MSPQDGFGKKPPFKDNKFSDKKFGDKKFGDKKFGDKKFGDKNNSLDMHGSIPKKPVVKFDRIAKVMARAGLCSRRDAERWIEDKRVSVNGRLLTTPAVKVTDKDIIKVDGKVIKAPEATRLWKYYKPAGLVTTHGDPEGRPTVFSRLRSEGLPRVVSIGRLDINTEGMLLITNNGALARYLEMPSTGWQRKYRARAYGKVTQTQLDGLKNGVTIEGIRYGAILATLERQVGDNCWVSLSLREGKNREIKEVLGSLGLQVNRLIRLSYGPFKLDNMERGTVEPITTKMLKDQLGDMFDEIDEGYDSELRPQDQIGYHIDKRDGGSKPKFNHKRSNERDDKRGGSDNRGGGERRDSNGGRSFGNDRNERRDGEKRYEKRPDSEQRFDRRPDGEKRPGRNNERPSYNRDRKERDDRSGRSRTRDDNRGDNRSRGNDDTRGKRNDGRNPERSEYRGGNDARRDDKGNRSFGGKSAGFNKGKPGKSGTGHRERARGGKPAGNRSGAPRSSNSPRRDG